MHNLTGNSISPLKIGLLSHFSLLRFPKCSKSLGVLPSWNIEITDQNYHQYPSAAPVNRWPAVCCQVRWDAVATADSFNFLFSIEVA